MGFFLKIKKKFGLFTVIFCAQKGGVCVEHPLQLTYIFNLNRSRFKCQTFCHGVLGCIHGVCFIHNQGVIVWLFDPKNPSLHICHQEPSLSKKGFGGLKFLDFSRFIINFSENQNFTFVFSQGFWLVKKVQAQSAPCTQAAFRSPQAICLLKSNVNLKSTTNFSTLCSQFDIIYCLFIYL